MSTVAVVTGANQGLGLALVRRLCRLLGSDATTYLGARDRGRGEAAVQRLRSEGLAPVLHVVDVRDTAAVEAFADTVREAHGGIDIVLSNAAARRTPALPEAAQIQAFVDTNNFGAHRMIRAFTPLLNDGAGFIVVASAFGSLHYLPRAVHHHFDTRSMTLAELEEVLTQWVRLVEAGDAREGWPDDVNAVSKVGQVAAVRIVARDLARIASSRAILINAACPGLVDTDASRPWFADMAQAQTPDEAAVDVAWLATLPAGTAAPYGELVQHRDVIPFGADEWVEKYGSRTA
jgi:carbonyl reductase 1